jgi:hypothetical protein
MVDDTAGTDWLYRRDHRIRRPVAELYGPASAAGRPVLTPEVQLLYKSRTARPKDAEDFSTLVGVLEATRRDWLRRALSTVSPGHEWLDRL